MKRVKYLAPLALLAAFASPGCGSESSEGISGDSTSSGNSVTVDNFTMAWEINGETIEITMEAPSTGWVAVGFEPSSAMKDADIIIGYVVGEEVFISDEWGDGFISHRADIDLGGSDDVSAIAGSESAGTTEISFSIPLNSGDTYDKIIVPGNSYKVILAFGADNADDFQGYHVWAETVELEF